MSDLLRYAGLSVLVVVLGNLLLLPLLEGSQREALAVGSGIALAAQFVAFGFSHRLRRRGAGGFLMAMVGGALGRLAILFVVGVWATEGSGAPSAAPLILGTTGFLFVLLLLETRFLQDPTGSKRTE